MDQPEQVTYPPLNTLKPVASEVWIVDGPEIRFGFPWPKMAFAAAPPSFAAPSDGSAAISEPSRIRQRSGAV
jgi:hypothetical protein